MVAELPASSDALDVTRVRHALTLRLATVARVAPITPHLIRITLRGAELRGFESASFDDHVKVFFPAPGTSVPVLPLIGSDGPARPAGAVPSICRDFTPRRFDPIAGELDLEFFLHEAGPATTWAVHAAVGQSLGIGGPRGSMIIPTRFDWHLLIGDDTALPAMARRLEELPRGVRAIVIAEVAGSYAQVDFKSHVDMQVTWCHREGPKPRSMAEALEDLPPLPPGEGYAWAAGEAADVRRIRSQLVSRGMDKSRIRAAAYWKRGAPGLHEVIDD
jgi:NADPH-dependent ferric siderophore reductase